MDVDNLSPDLSGKNLKCRNCENYLSYLPIYSTTSGQNICGRCAVTTEKKYTRNLAFEVLCQHVYFPCRFKNEGCEEKILPKDIPNHEQACQYKIIKCPNSNMDCKWKGALPTVIQHCLDKHFETFLSENCDFTVDLTKSHHSENFFRHDEILYTFSRKFDTTTNILQCSIHHIKGAVNMANYSCTITLKNGSRILSDECCTTAYNEKEYTNVVLESLKIVATPCISGKITIDNSIEDMNSVQERINEELLCQLKCTKCFVYVLPPIYHYKDNNIYCHDCKTKYQYRNYNLDNIANMLNYPCKNKDNGCDIILKPEEMKKHQEMCEYGEHDCIFWEYVDCLWKGIGKDMLSHFQNKHKEDIIENGTKISEYFYEDLTTCYLIQYSNHLFRLVVSIADDEDDDEDLEKYFRCTVQKVGYFKGDFKYKIEVICKSDEWRKVSRSQLCSSQLTDRRALFKNKNEYCYFTYDQLRGLLKIREDEKCVTFKVCIFQ